MASALVLHFGAVDYAATVWVNGHAVVRHEGGYTPFAADITHELTGDGPQSVVVRAIDDPHDLAKPRGKQDWQLEPHQIWYPRTSGIWQTVWLERLAASAIASVRWTPSLERWEIGFEATLDGVPRDDLRLRVELTRERARARRRHVCRRAARSDAPDRAFGPGDRRLPQRTALAPFAPDTDRCARRAARW